MTIVSSINDKIHLFQQVEKVIVKPLLFGGIKMNNAAWISLLIAGIFEVIWALAMKQSNGFTKLWPSVVTFAAMWASFAFLSFALKSLPLGISYAIWVGIGTVGVSIFSVIWLRESITIFQIICIILILVGIIGLKFQTN
ncbi:multidrug efflux SMR transporter [Pseudoalteromonas sp. S2721]|uniref:DMT family transporter n=1 Tax=Pseudoalteromonas sp. S2721 TaxID=579526 RepID=UPI00201702D1|nr:multidrug efflux SMR transporter [Pseudoalteromonas sp. S2721]